MFPLLMKSSRAFSCFARLTYSKIRFIVKSGRTLENPIKSVIPIHKNFHTTNRINAKLFIDKENAFAHEVLENYSNYNLFQKPTASPASNTEAIEAVIRREFESSGELLQALKDVVNFTANNQICISEERFDEFVDRFAKDCHQFTTEQLIECLQLLSLLPTTESVNTRNFLEIWSALDEACCFRLQKLSEDEIFLICDCWYSLKLGRCSEFIWQALKRIGRRTLRLSPQQLVQTLFFCNIVRKPLIEMFELEMNFKKILNSLSLDEIAVVCMGFFKTQSPLRDPDVIATLYRRLMAEADTVKDITLVNIMKILRYSSKIPQAEIMVELLDKLCPQIERVSFLSCLHIALTGCDIQHSHDRSIELIVRRFIRDIQQARIKDMERICHVMGLFNFETPSGIEKELCEKILANIRNRSEEIIRYPRCLPACLHYLTLCGFHDEELISTALDQKFIQHAYGRNMLLGREIFCLDSYAKINLRETYRGNELQDRQRRTMGKCLTHYIPDRTSKYKLNVTDKILLEVKESFESVFRVSSLKHVLPHFERPDVVFCFDKQKNHAIPLSASCPEDYKGSILSREDVLGDNHKNGNLVSVVVAVGGWNNFVRNRDNHPTGLLKLKMNQIKLLGHKLILIPWFEWRQLETFQDRHDAVRRKLLSVL